LNKLLRLAPITQQPGSPSNLTGVSDAKGFFNIRSAPGQYFLSVSGPANVFYPGVLNQAEAKPVVVTAGVVSGGMDFSLPPSASGVSVRGRVSIPANYPTAATELRVESVRQGIGARVTSDGTFELAHILPGNYSLVVNAPAAQPIAVRVTDRDVTGIELSVPPMVPVRGTVAVDSNGVRPRFEIRFSALQPPGTVPGPFTQPYMAIVNAESNGIFTTQLPAGKYQLALNKLPDNNFIKSISTAATNLLESALEVSPADSPVGISISLGTSPKVRVRGRVIQSNGSAADRITLTTVALNESAEAAIVSDGTFDLTAVRPGPYLARVGLTSRLSSPPVFITIPNRNMTDLEIPIPSPRDIFGRIAVDGNGPPPKFALLLIQGPGLPVNTGRPGEPASVDPAALMNLVQSGGRAGTHILQVDVNALPDGGFKMSVPDGDYRVAVVMNAIPAPYFVRSLTANSVDLMTEPLRVSEKESTQINVGFGISIPNPWVKVSGRISGLDSSRNTYRVALESGSTSAIETHIDTDGRFEFPAVFQRMNYTARLIPPIPAASSPRVNVADKDVTDVRIVVPPEREMMVRVSVEGGSKSPAFGLSLNGQDSSMLIVVRPEADGTFKTKVPEDERRVSITGLPLGYEITSAMFGSTDILRQPMKISGSAAGEIQIRLAVDPAVAWGSVRGRVTGLDMEKGSVRLVLNSAESFSTFEATINADGSFNFPRVPQGTYIPSLDGAIVAKRLSAAPIVVTGIDVAGIEIAAPRQSDPSPPASAETPTGAVASDFPGGGRAAANESAAVANLRTINTAQITFLSITRGNWGSLQDLVQAALLDRTFLETKSGFNFSIVVAGGEYGAAAIPASSATGRFGYFSSPDAVVRYSTFEPLAPPQQGGRAVQ
jgi:hypothetical protein